MSRCIVSEQLAYKQADAAKMLGVSVSTFQRQIRPQLPQPVFLGGRLLFKHVDLQRWLDRQ